MDAVPQIIMCGHSLGMVGANQCMEAIGDVLEVSRLRIELL